MESNYLVKFQFFILFIFLTIIPAVFAISIRAPYIAIHCNVDTTFLDNNLCPTANCTPKVSKSEYGNYYSVGNVVIGIRNNTDEINFFNDPNYLQPIDDITWEFLKEVCTEEIDPILNRIKQGNFSGMWCDFYQDRNKLVYKTKIESVDEWYLGCSSYTPSSANPMTYIYGFFWGGVVGGVMWIPFMIMLSFFTNWFIIPLIVLVLIFLYFKKRNKLNAVYILPLVFGLIGGIISFFVSKNKRIGLKLLLLGFVISLIFGLLSTIFFFI